MQLRGTVEPATMLAETAAPTETATSVAGILAAILFARRASRLNVLEELQYE